MVSSKELKKIGKKQLLTTLLLVVLEVQSRRWSREEKLRIVEYARDLLNIVIPKSGL